VVNYKNLLSELNQEGEESYLQTLTEIRKIWDQIKGSEDKFLNFAFEIADRILIMSQFEKEYSESYYMEKTLEELKAFNQTIFSEILPENYEKSYANPEYSVEIFGDDLGVIFSTFYLEFRGFLTKAIKHHRYLMELWNNSFLEFYELLKKGITEKDSYLKITTQIYKNPTTDDQVIHFLENYSSEVPGFRSIVMNADLSDFRYLYQYGKYITENELKTAEFFLKYPEDKIQKLVKAMVKAFIRGFELARKDISQKETVNIYYNIGQEKLAKALVNELENNNLKALINTVSSTVINRQYNYDHRFIGALFLDEDLAKKSINVIEQAAEKCVDVLVKFAGPFYFDKFGEQPFDPKHKDACLKLSPEQQKLLQTMSIKRSKIVERYIYRSKTSFCIIGFPVPEIGDKFEDIFEETLTINMIDSIHHEEIQQHIIDVLDQAEYVHIKGKNGNLTDIKVKMQKLEDPTIQTNFVNCGAEVNIPVGEVFTSPQLDGTNGVLHLKETFLKSLKFTDLKLTFKDGYVSDYSCKNFDDKEKNQKYIQENLLFPHKTLPIGEFAIGTNTQAYVMAKKFDILPILPVLIVEKMGPHFAIGDTCFSWEEDFKVYNPIDNKEITAHENEKSALRKTDIQQAYTNCHTDITLPYEDLDFISAITKDGEKIDIIRDGRFVVPGTEELNKSLDDFDRITG